VRPFVFLRRFGIGIVAELIPMGLARGC
jgi:hypothetical protein